MVETGRKMDEQLWKKHEKTTPIILGDSNGFDQ
jgi:hypothetical protein